jgi:hypothetical protein
MKEPELHGSWKPVAPHAQIRRMGHPTLRFGWHVC